MVTGVAGFPIKLGDILANLDKHCHTGCFIAYSLPDTSTRNVEGLSGQGIASLNDASVRSTDSNNNKDGSSGNGKLIQGMRRGLLASGEFQAEMELTSVAAFPRFISRGRAICIFDYGCTFQGKYRGHRVSVKWHHVEVLPSLDLLMLWERCHSSQVDAMRALFAYFYQVVHTACSLKPPYFMYTIACRVSEVCAPCLLITEGTCPSGFWTSSVTRVLVISYTAFQTLSNTCPKEVNIVLRNLVSGAEKVKAWCNH